MTSHMTACVLRWEKYAVLMTNSRSQWNGSMKKVRWELDCLIIDVHIFYLLYCNVCRFWYNMCYITSCICLFQIWPQRRLIRRLSMSHFYIIIKWKFWIWFLNYDGTTQRGQVSDTGNIFLYLAPLLWSDGK